MKLDEMEPVDRVAERKLRGQRRQALCPLLDDTAASDQVDAGQAKLDGLDTKAGQSAKISLKAIEFSVDGAGIETRSR